METACFSELSALTHHTSLVSICILFYGTVSKTGNVILLQAQIMYDGMQRTSEGNGCSLIEVKITDILSKAVTVTKFNETVSKAVPGDKTRDCSWKRLFAQHSTN